MSQDARGTPSNTLSGPVVLGAVALTGAALGLGWYLTHRGQLQYWGLERHTRKSGWEQGEAGGIGSGRFPRNPAPGLGAVCGGISVHPSSYPWGRREEECADLVHGAYVPDPYRWLEDPSDPECAGFAEAQSTLTNSLFPGFESFVPFTSFITKLASSPRYGCPIRAGEKFSFYVENTGLQEQDVLYVQEGLQGPTKLLLDPNDWSDDGNVALTGMFFSEDGSLLAYTRSYGQLDWQTIHVMRIKWDVNPPTDQGLEDTHLKDKLENVKYSPVVWTHDNKGFFYCRFPGPKGRMLDVTDNKPLVDHQLCYHILGTPQNQDRVVFTLPENPSWLLHPELSNEGEYLLINIKSGFDTPNMVYFLNIAKIPRTEGALNFAEYDFYTGNVKLPVEKLVGNLDAEYTFICNEGSEFTFHTNHNAPRYKVARTSLEKFENPSRWEAVIPEHGSDVLLWAKAVKGDKLVACFSRDCCGVVEIRSLSKGTLIHSIGLEGLGSVGSFSGNKQFSEILFSYSTPTEPPTIYKFDTETMDLSVHKQTAIEGFNADDMETKQVFVNGWDGTQIPMFITHKKGLEMSGENPTLLCGHGGPGNSMLPAFSLHKLCFIMGFNGVVANANCRGGSEYGTEWHLAGVKQGLQNAIDDLTSCAEFLTTAKYTSPEKLGIEGENHGGLLVAACALYHPDLFGCVLAQSALLDLLRFQNFTIGPAWIPKYGHCANLEDFSTLYRISPVHNIQVPQGGTRQFPSILITSGENDDRVVMAHTLKFIATLQHIFAGDREGPQRNPLCAKIFKDTGHCSGKPASSVILEVAEKYSFLAAALKAKYVIEPSTE